MKYMIVDDEPIAHEIIKEYASALSHLELVSQCYDPIEALKKLRTLEVDFLFLDIHMPKMKGFELLRTLKNPPKVIVTTAYDKFAVEGYELDIVDYLMKPFDFERFVKAINKLTENRNYGMPMASKELIQENRRIFLRSNRMHVQVDLDNIIFIESIGNYCNILLEGEKIKVREKISDLLRVLPEKEFLQVHKSFIVAIKRIRSIEGNRIHIGDHIVPIGQLYKGNVNKLIQ
ncbi:DNA-binding response regulator [Flagellimonas lutimaris]|uniref:DNA-binding response regulator n=1 Tax=Flagellimonas lutimaris TaxID=475082 RepID=A0A3A1NAU9_9FLAO|nr:response regulator transcription factor [Allomuricauda lutimaris]RIV36697.1 DNA-binding response regulator [Allomuricauda lutimaris]